LVQFNVTVFWNSIPITPVTYRLEVRQTVVELEERIGRLERVSVRIALLGGVIIGGLTVLTLAAFEYGKLVKYLWRAW